MSFYSSPYRFHFRNNTPLEITTKIGCRNMCEYCPQTKLIKRYQERNLKFQQSGGLKKDRMMSFDTFSQVLICILLDMWNRLRTQSVLI